MVKELTLGFFLDKITEEAFSSEYFHHQPEIALEKKLQIPLVSVC